MKLIIENSNFLIKTLTHFYNKLDKERRESCNAWQTTKDVPAGGRLIVHPIHLMSAPAGHVLATHPKSSLTCCTEPEPEPEAATTTLPSPSSLARFLPPNQSSHQPRAMASPFCAAAAACRLAVPAPSPPAARAPRPRRGLVAVRAEAGGGTINPAIRKEEDKVVDTVLTGELAKPLTAYCRYVQLSWTHRVNSLPPACYYVSMLACLTPIEGGAVGVGEGYPIEGGAGGVGEGYEQRMLPCCDLD